MMSRLKRELKPGYCYHITVRCNNREFRLTRLECREVLLYAIRRCQEKYGFVGILDFRFWILDLNEAEFKRRTKAVALRVIRLVEALPLHGSAGVIGKQLLRSATSVGANYRAACRAKSIADIIAKLSIVEEEADECLYWMELLVESGLVPETKLKSLMAEVNEIVAMTVQSIKTLRTKSQRATNLKSKI